MILGNDLAGRRVWADGKPYIFDKQPSVPPAGPSPDCSDVPREVIPLCAVTHATARMKEGEVKPENLEFSQILSQTLDRTVVCFWR